MIVFIDLKVKIAKRKPVFEIKANKIEEGTEISICYLLKLSEPIANYLQLSSSLF